jgi:polyhydroxyalkanoate synthesis regulator phasin
MTVEDFQQTLGQCFNSTDDPTIKGFAEQANSYTELVKSGQLSRDEYVELMKDLQRQASIDSSVAHQQVLIAMHTAITGLITIVSAVA